MVESAGPYTEEIGRLLREGSDDDEKLVTSVRDALVEIRRSLMVVPPASDEEHVADKITIWYREAQDAK